VKPVETDSVVTLEKDVTAPDESMRRVTIFIPTYRNEHLILACVRSCLAQTYTNIQVVVVDNGFSECRGSLGKELEQLHDTRIVYHPNTSNIGCQGNFSLILSLAQMTSRFMIIPADVLLVNDCIEKMVAAAETTPSANMVYSRSISRDVRRQPLTPETDGVDQLLPWPHQRVGAVSSADLIRLFYSRANLDSDWSHFSYIGSLIDGALIRSVAMPRFHLWDHGNEKLISLTLLSYADEVVILSDPLLIHYTNAERLGTAKRVGLNYTRYEPLCAQYQYLEAYEPHLVRRGIKLSGLYLFLLFKTAYTMVRYPGPVYLLVPKALSTFLRTFLCILPVEGFLNVYKKFKGVSS
jgi:glycosyltransferase involved in cell wall biosynthesis